MTARIDPSQRKRRPQDDLTPKPRVKRGANSTPEGKAKRVAALRKTPTNGGNIAIIEQQNPNRPLTEKQRLFVKEWASGETILSASVRAGYADSGAMGYRMAKDPAVLKIYHEEKAKYAEVAQMDRQKVMDMLLEAYEQAKLMAEPASMVAAAREVGKMCGFYEPTKIKMEVNHSGKVLMQQVSNMSDDELLKCIEDNSGVIDVAFKEVTSDISH